MILAYSLRGYLHDLSAFQEGFRVFHQEVLLVYTLLILAELPVEQLIEYLQGSVLQSGNLIVLVLGGHLIRQPNEQR